MIFRTLTAFIFAFILSGCNNHTGTIVINPEAYDYDGYDLDAPGPVFSSKGSDLHFILDGKHSRKSDLIKPFQECSNPRLNFCYVGMYPIFVPKADQTYEQNLKVAPFGYFPERSFLTKLQNENSESVAFDYLCEKKPTQLVVVEPGEAKWIYEISENGDIVTIQYSRGEQEPWIETHIWVKESMPLNVLSGLEC